MPNLTEIDFSQHAVMRERLKMTKDGEGYANALYNWGVWLGDVFGVIYEQKAHYDIYGALTESAAKLSLRAASMPSHPQAERVLDKLGGLAVIMDTYAGLTPEWTTLEDRRLLMQVVTRAVMAGSRALEGNN